MFDKRKNLTLLLYSLILLNEIRLSVSIVKEDVIDKSKKDEETVLTPDDFAHIPEKEVDLTELGIDVKKDPTLGEMVEGDMVLVDRKHPGKRSVRLQRSAIIHESRKWPYGEIPYTLSTQYGGYARSIIAGAMDQFHRNTCIRFVPRNPTIHDDYVYIHPDDGCYSLVGRGRGKQPLSLVEGCIQIGIIAHELMHASGFFHEQSRTDRDSYVKILWENIKRGLEDQFEKYDTNVVDNLGQPYDYSSIMHYEETAFSANGKPTIVKIKSSPVKIGQRDGLSKGDILELNLLYNCRSRPLPDSSGTAIRTPKPSINQCFDTNTLCYLWAQTGQCRLPSIMTLCPKSCGLCGRRMK